MGKKILISILLFALIGELLVRINEKLSPFNDNNIVMKLGLQITPEYNLLMSNSIDTNANNLRILIIGDCYIHGGGIDFKNNFSSHLKSILKKNNKKFDNIFVLDASKALSNNFDNEQNYYFFSKKFKPQIVIIGFSYDGVIGELDKQVQYHVADTRTKVQPTGVGAFFTSKTFRSIYIPHLGRFILSGLYNTLKVHGFIVPNCNFDLKLKSYSQNKENWIKSKKLFENIIQDTKKNKAQLLVLKFPEINLMEYNHLFTNADSAISNFFHKYPAVVFVDIAAMVKGIPPQELWLSKYDGHINARGHKKVAKKVANIIEDMQGFVKD